MSKKSKRIPMRRCMGCNTPKAKNELLRIVRSNLGNIEIDLDASKER